MKRLLLLVAVTWLTNTPIATGDGARGVGSSTIPLEINHQGVVAVNGQRYSGDADFCFALVDPGPPEVYLWTNDGSAPTPPNPPTNCVNIPVVDGLFNICLGDTSLANMTAIPSAAFDNPAIALRVWFDDGTHGVQQLTPDHVLKSSPYAFRAESAERVDFVDNAELTDTLTASSLDLGGASPPIGGKLDVLDTDDSLKVRVSTGNGGQCLIRDGAGNDRAHLLGGATGGQLFLSSDTGAAGVALEADSVGGGGAMRLYNGQQQVNPTIVLDGKGPDNSGDIHTLNASGAVVARLWSPTSGDGRVTVSRADGSLGITLEAEGGGGGVIHMRSTTASTNTITLAAGGDGPDGAGVIALNNGQSPNRETINLDASGGDGGALIKLRNDEPTNPATTITLDASAAGSYSGYIALRNGEDPYQGALTAELLANYDQGAAQIGGGLVLRDLAATMQISLSGGDGNIIACTYSTGGCDVAEAFRLTGRDDIKPGMVMVMDAERAGHLRISTTAYDAKVAGIVSGAGGLSPGMRLGKRDDGSSDLPIALSGRVYCYADAGEQAIAVGDLLTTSDTPGHAMKAVDRKRAFGAVIGKAMEPLAKGEKGLLLVLVALQ